MKNKLILISVTLMLGAVSSHAADKSGSTQICVFDALNKNYSVAAADLKQLKSSDVSIQEYFDGKKDSDLEHSFESFVQAQVASGRHCDGLVITGHYGESPEVYGEDKASKPLNLNLVQKLLSQPRNKAWASEVKAVYFDGAYTTTAQATLSSSFPPGTQFLGCSDHRPRGTMPKERALREQMAQAFVKASSGGNIEVEEEQISQGCAALTGPGSSYSDSVTSVNEQFSSMTEQLDQLNKQLEEMMSPKALFKALPKTYVLMPERADDPSLQPGAVQPQTPATAGVTLTGPKPASK